ncbi:MAG: hypothetical protein RLP02_18515 [Coleofasciculus sp. C2-GNP5-27]
MKKRWVSSGLLAVLAVCLSPMTSLAGFGDLIRDVNDAVNTINNTRRAVDGTVNNLSDVLGIDGNVSDSDDPTQQVLDLYQSWYQQLAASEQELVSALIMQYAKNQQMTFETLSTTEWFLQQSMQDQQKIGGLFFKVNQILEGVEETGGERNRFLAFAFCVNSGGQDCN